MVLKRLSRLLKRVSTLLERLGTKLSPLGIVPNAFGTMLTPVSIVKVPSAADQRAVSTWEMRAPYFLSPRSLLLLAL
jgi:hypothetical protein